MSDKLKTVKEIDLLIAETLQLIEHNLGEMKVEDIVVLPIAKISTIADYFVIATGRSKTHIRAVAEKLAMEMKKSGIVMPIVDSDEDRTWVIIDCKDVVVHIMQQETREYYDLESLWFNDY